MSDHKVSPTNAQSEDEILTLFDRYADFIEQSGRKAHRSSRQDARKIIASMSDAKKAQVVERLQSDVALFQDVLSAGERLSDSRRLLWRFFNKNGFVPCADIFSKMGDNNIIEIYGVDQVHLWQSLNFFDWISVALERVFCETWYQATKREERFAAEIYGIALKVFSGQIKETVAPVEGWHWMEELDSEMLFKFQIRVQWVSPIFRAGQVAGLIAVNECKDLIVQRGSWNGC